MSLGSFDSEFVLDLIVKVFTMLMILPIHEFAHAWAAYKLGDDTAYHQGRMTLNPLAHLDPVGALCMLTIGFGWAKPVPIDPTRFNRKHSMRFGVAITALAGPLSNLIVALIGTVAFQIYNISDYYRQYMELSAIGEATSNAPQMVNQMLVTFIMINVGLCVFNMIPIPPLDGSKILSYFTSAKFDRWFIENQQIVRIAFFILLVSPVLRVPMFFVEGKLVQFLFFITSWIPSFFG